MGVLLLRLCFMCVQKSRWGGWGGDRTCWCKGSSWGSRGDNSPRENVGTWPSGWHCPSFLTVVCPAVLRAKPLVVQGCFFLWLPPLPLLVIQTGFVPVYFSHALMCLVYMCVCRLVCVWAHLWGAHVCGDLRLVSEIVVLSHLCLIR